jgi:hypothetical protein
LVERRKRPEKKRLQNREIRGSTRPPGFRRIDPAQCRPSLQVALRLGTLGGARSFTSEEQRRIEMTTRKLLLVGVAACGLATLATGPAAARTLCDSYGNCYNTSGRPIYQPQYGYGYGYVQTPYWEYRRHYHRHYDDSDEY